MAVIRKMRLIGKTKLDKKFQALINEVRRLSSPSIAVGYTANYALVVHESKKMQEHREARRGRGQWKFLEQPAREKQRELAAVISSAVENGVSIEKALVMAGLLLQRESQKLVPVDTGNLKGSAFTKVERE